MDYFRLLKFKKEPFSNSPDPDLFFPSFSHRECMQKVELAVRLKRGLNVVVGPVGTGKTTLCRALIRRFADDDKITTHLFLDPGFASETEFLNALLASFYGRGKRDDPKLLVEPKERIKEFLFCECVEKGRTHLVIIDEGQKLPAFAIEILRELLNYETNDYKLLQILIFAQPEFENTLRETENFMDRVNLFYRLRPLTLRETMGFIKFRMGKASEGMSVVKFTMPAFWKVYELTGGYPRRIVHLCHQAVLALIIQDKTRVTSRLVTAAASRTTREIGVRRHSFLPLAGAMAVGVILIFVGIFLLGGPETSQRHVGNTHALPVGREARSGDNVASHVASATVEPGTGEENGAGKKLAVAMSDDSADAAARPVEKEAGKVLEPAAGEPVAVVLKLKTPATKRLPSGRRVKVLRPRLQKRMALGFNVSTTGGGAGLSRPPVSLGDDSSESRGKEL